jgi:hypothetical protein
LKRLDLLLSTEGGDRDRCRQVKFEEVRIERSEYNISSKMPSTESVVLNFFYCFGCGRNWMARGFACWTRMSDSVEVMTKALGWMTFMVETVVECYDCERRRREETPEMTDITWMKERGVTNVGGLLGNSEFYEATAFVRRRYAPMGRRCVAVLFDKGSDECVVVEYGVALDLELAIPLVRMEQVMKGLKDSGDMLDIGTSELDGVVGRTALGFIAESNLADGLIVFNDGEGGWSEDSRIDRTTQTDDMGRGCKTNGDAGEAGDEEPTG